MFKNMVLRHPDDEGGGGDLVEEFEDTLEPEPEPVGPHSIGDDGEFTWEGLDGPLTGQQVREGHMRQADYTRKTQELANQQQHWQQRAQEGERAMQYARQLEARLQQPQQQAPQPPPANPLASTYERMTRQGEIPTSREFRALEKHQAQGLTALEERFDKQQGQLEYIVRDYIGTKQSQYQMLQQHEHAKNDATLQKSLENAKVSDAQREIAYRLARNQFERHEPDPSRGETWDTYRSYFETEMFPVLWREVMGASRASDREDLAAAKRDSLPRQGGSASPSGKLKPSDDDPTSFIDKFEPEGGWTD